jgi:hypothetical protein
VSHLRRIASGVALAVYIALAPSEVPPWRLDPSQRIVAELAVGEPVPSLGTRR